MKITEKTEHEIQESGLSRHEVSILKPKLGGLIIDSPQIESLVTSSMDLDESSKDVIRPEKI